MKTHLTQRRLMELLTYDQDTGLFWWKDRPQSDFATPQAYGSWKAKTAGKPAGRLDGTGYIVIRIDGLHWPAHRLAWLFTFGCWPEGQVDHINRVRSDNRMENLRDVQPIENQRNRSLQKNNTSGVSGVYFDERSAKWCARIWVKSATQSLGMFLNRKDAIAARKAAERRYGFHPNHGRAE